MRAQDVQWENIILLVPGTSYACDTDPGGVLSVVSCIPLQKRLPVHIDDISGEVCASQQSVKDTHPLL